MYSNYKFYFLIFFEIIFFLIFLLSLILLLLLRRDSNASFKTNLVFIINNFDKNDNSQINGDDNLLINSYKEFISNNYKIYFLYKNKNLIFFANFLCLIYLIKNRPKYICFRSDYHNSNSYLFLSSLFFIKYFLKIKMIPISNDSCWAINIYRIKIIRKFLSDLFYIEDRNLFLKKDIKKRIIPTNLNLFMFDNFKKNKKYDIIFIGRTEGRGEREKFISKLSKKIDLHIFDSSKNYLSQEKYYEKILNSKYIINFTRSPNNKIHFTSRSLQAIALGCIVLEPEFSYLGKKLLIKNKDYLEYSDINSVLKLVHLNNDKNIINIHNTRNKLKDLYINNNLWVNSEL